MGISVDKPKEPMVVLMVTPAMENYTPGTILAIF